MLVADEVQTGFGRTGTLFAIEQSGVEPDLICVAKSIAAGLPLSGVLGRAELMDAPGDSTIGGTYVGNPVACQAALAVLDEIDRLDLCGRAAAIGEAMHARIADVSSRVPQLGDVRGLGSMLGLEFVRDPATREPGPEIASRVVELALERRADPAQGGPLRQRRTQPRAARDHRRPARRGARRAGSGDRARRRARHGLICGVTRPRDGNPCRPSDHSRDSAGSGRTQEG